MKSTFTWFLLTMLNLLALVKRFGLCLRESVGALTVVGLECLRPFDVCLAFRLTSWADCEGYKEDEAW